MSRSHRQLVDAERAEFSALARMFRCWTSPDAVHDGRDLVDEAIGESAELRKAIAQHLYAAFSAGEEVDHCALGKTVAEGLIARAKSCPRYEDYRSEAEADLCEHEGESER